VGNKFSRQNGNKNNNRNNNNRDNRNSNNRNVGNGNMKEVFQSFQNNYRVLLDVHAALKANDRELSSDSYKKYKEFDDKCMLIAQKLNSTAARRILTETYSILSGKNQDIKLIQLSQKLHYIANRQTGAGNRSKELAMELSKLCKFLSRQGPEAAELPKMIMEGVVCYVEG
jgi:hypothetical protein